jgi:hypothetical protein
MSTMTKKEYLVGDKPRYKSFPRACFMCGEDLFDDSERSTNAVVIWHGHSYAYPDDDQGEPTIALHQVCAEEMGLHLIQDARTAMERSGERVRPASGFDRGTWKVMGNE